jgi:hypothetical protein
MPIFGRREPPRASLQDVAKALVAVFETAVTDGGGIAAALVIELARVRQAIEPSQALRIVLETVNGMAKTAPMTVRHMREATAG